MNATQTNTNAKGQAMQLTDATRRLFVSLADDAANWMGEPLLGGNFPTDRHTNGNVTDLKSKGLITTFDDDGDIFVQFTDAGRKFAAEIGHPVD